MVSGLIRTTSLAAPNVPSFRFRCFACSLWFQVVVTASRTFPLAQFAAAFAYVFRSDFLIFPRFSRGSLWVTDRLPI